MQHLRAAWHPIPAAPRAFRLFIHAQYHTLPFPWYFFSHLVSSHTLLPPLSPVHRGLISHQHLSPGLQLCIWTIACVSQSLLCMGYSSCRGAYWREDRGRRKERSLQDPGLQSIMGPLKVTISVSWCWELKTLGMLEICEVEATVEPGQQWTWRSADLNTNLLLKIKWKCRLQMQYSKTCFKSG